jgi:hypothetical protein
MPDVNTLRLDYSPLQMLHDGPTAEQAARIGLIWMPIPTLTYHLAAPPTDANMNLPHRVLVRVPGFVRSILFG